MTSWCWGSGDGLAFFSATAEAVEVAFAQHDLFALFLKLNHHGMHFVNRLLESLKVSSNCNNVFIKCRDFLLLSIKVSVD